MGVKVYWKCEVCDDTNLYPDEKVCACCGAAITPQAKKQALEDLAKALEKKKKDEENAELIKKMREENEKRRQAEEKKILKKMHIREREEKTAAGIRKFTRISVYSMIAVLILMIALTVIVVITGGDALVYNAKGAADQVISMSACHPVQNLLI